MSFSSLNNSPTPLRLRVPLSALSSPLTPQNSRTEDYTNRSVVYSSISHSPSGLSRTHVDQMDQILPPISSTFPPDSTLLTVPTVPTEVQEWKYKRMEYYSMKPEDAKVSHIQAFQDKFERKKFPSKWQACICPEGKLYFVHTKQRVVTLTNIQNEVKRRTIEEAIEKLYTELRIPDSQDRELVLNYTPQESTPERKVGYYVADWSKQIILWDQKVSHDLVTKNERPPVSEPHLLYTELALQSQFGLHVEIFCAHRPLPHVMTKEVKDSFSSGLVDVITSELSMFSYDTETTNNLAKVVDKVSVEEEIRPHDAWVIGRLYKTLYQDRYLAFYGESDARCSRSDSAFGKETTNPRSIIFFMISPFLFFMPLVYLKELDAVFIDRTIHYHAWRRFIGVLRHDWEEAITPATVLLSANVGFLAIQSVDLPGQDRSLAQILSYMSAVLSLFIYIVCQILTRRHRHFKDEQADRALNYLVTRQKRLMGLQAVAIAFSLPIALFIWSMLTFLGAMVFVFFDKTSVATRTGLGTILGVLVFFTMVLLYMEWDIDSPKSGLRLFQSEFPMYFKRDQGGGEERPTMDTGDYRESHASSETIEADAKYEPDAQIYLYSSWGKRFWNWGRSFTTRHASARENVDKEV